LLVLVVLKILISTFNYFEVHTRLDTGFPQVRQ